MNNNTFVYVSNTILHNMPLTETLFVFIPIDLQMVNV